MFNLKIFAARSITELQENVNMWLKSNRDISILRSNMNTLPDPSVAEQYIYHILYTSSENQAEELLEMAAEVKPEDTVEATEINPDVLNATS